MPDSRHVISHVLGFRGNRRRAAQALTAAVGSLLVFEPITDSLVLAQDSDDDDSSGRGRGRGGDDDRDNSGPGNADDRDGNDDHDDELDESEIVPVTGVVPEGAVEIRIVSEDAGGFVPEELTVDLGQIVAFVNTHDDEHTATGSAFDTGEIERGAVATVELDTPGTFPYACQFHPVMTGQISVRGTDGVVPRTQTVAQEVPADATPVRIVNLSFDPAELTIPTGTAVSWTNDDSVPHTVTATDGVFDSGIFDPGASFTWTFDQPGSFAYICQLHPQMQGTVIVEGEAVASAPDSTAAHEAESTLEQVAVPTDSVVSIVDFAFEPATLDIPSGTTVVWTNDGQVPHTVTGEFADSGILDPGQTFSHTFAEGGEFSYACALHPDMLGTVRVSGTAVGDSAQPATAAAGPDLEGVWLIELTPDDEAIFGAQQVLATFHVDGTVEADFSASPGGDTPTRFLTSGRGEWVFVDAVCSVALVALVNDANWQFAGTVTLNARGQLGETGRVLDGAFEFTVVSADGQTLGEGSGSISGGLVPLEP